jgi:hypothetical protein
MYTFKTDFIRLISDIREKKLNEAGEILMRSFIICTVYQILLEYNENKAQNMYIRYEKSMQNFILKTKREETILQAEA